MWVRIRVLAFFLWSANFHPLWKEPSFGGTRGKSQEAAPLGLDNPTGLGLPPDPLSQVQLFTSAPPRCLPHSQLPEAGWYDWVCIRGSSGWQACLDYQQDSGLKQLGFGPLHGLWGKGLFMSRRSAVQLGQRAPLKRNRVNNLDSAETVR